MTQHTDLNKGNTKQYSQYKSLAKELKSTERQKLLEKQYGLCGICHMFLDYKTAVVDHEHRTDKIRGVLCNGCNVLVGKYENLSQIRRIIWFVYSNFMYVDFDLKNSYYSEESAMSSARSARWDSDFKTVKELQERAIAWVRNGGLTVLELENLSNTKKEIAIKKYAEYLQIRTGERELRSNKAILKIFDFLNGLKNSKQEDILNKISILLPIYVEKDPWIKCGVFSGLPLNPYEKEKVELTDYPLVEKYDISTKVIILKVIKQYNVLSSIKKFAIEHRKELAQSGFFNGKDIQALEDFQALEKLINIRTEKNNFMYILIYFLTWLTGIIFFLKSKDDRKKQHSIQAICLGIIIIAVSIIPYIGLLSILVWLYGLYIGYKASINNDVAIPYITDFAKKYT
jgi:uncharacterized membrane protein